MNVTAAGPVFVRYSVWFALIVDETSGAITLDIDGRSILSAKLKQ